MIFLLTACGQGGDGKPSAQGASGGSIAFQAVWPVPENEETKSSAENTETTPDVCTTFGIETVTALVGDGSGSEIGSGSWPCDTPDHTGTIGGIPPGGGYRVMVKGIVAGEVAWEGQASNITINAGRTTAVDKIVMHSLDFILTASSSDGGRIEPSGSIAASAIRVETFHFIPRSGYEVDDVIVDGTSLGYMESYTFSDIDTNHNIYVSFVPTGGTLTPHTITATAGGGGVILPEGQINVTEGNNQTFTFLPNTGNHIVDVFVDGISLGAMPSYTFNDVKADHTVRVAFDTTVYIITATAGSGGRIDSPGESNVPYGSTPTYTITADPGYRLSALTVNGQAIAPQSPYTFAPVTADGAIEAVFTRVWHVAADTNGDGTTWATAFATLGQAMAAAANGQEIWVKAGTYPLSGQVSINKSVEIYAGFDGSEHYRHQRDWADRPAIFDGQDTTRCFYITSDARLDGLDIRNGALSTGYAELKGGGMFIANSSPVIANCTLRNNSVEGTNTCYGGAVYSDNSSPIFENCHFEDNFLGCELGFGGALTLWDSITTIRNSRFINNRINWGLGGNGGAINIIRGAATIETSLFYQNLVSAESTSGGGITSDGTLTVDRCRFVENTAAGSRSSYGGAIKQSGSSAAHGESVIVNTIFLRNAAAGYARFADGGAISFSGDASPEILNCTFWENFTRSSETSLGGAIADVPGNPAITNSILWRNRTIIYNETTPSAPDRDGEGMQIYDDTASSATVTYSAIDQDGYTGNGNLRQHPQVDHFGHLQAGSACIDQGDDAAAPATDVDGESRPHNGRSDIGADEFLDEDDDLMPDYWEKRYGLNTGMDDADQDPDGDTLSNVEEYRAGLDPTVTQVAVNALHRGRYDHTGFHENSDDGTLCGTQGVMDYRSYLVFDMPGGSTVTGAVLRLEIAAYLGIRTSEAFDIYQVATDATTLEADSSGSTDIFNDLGDGNRYAPKISVTPADVNRVLSIHLNPEAIADINATGAGSFAIGLGRMQGMGETTAVSFSEASEPRVHQLVLIIE